VSAGRGTSPDRAGHCTKTAAEYLVMAEQCCRWARKTYPDEGHEIYLELARFWLAVASRLDEPRGSESKTGFKAVLARAYLQT